MARYRNLGGDSGVTAYEIGSDYIQVKFDGTYKTYTYSYRRAGRNHVEHMKTLALRGYGLNGYINSHVKKLYD